MCIIRKGSPRKGGGGTISADRGQYLKGDYVRGGQFLLSGGGGGGGGGGETKSAPTPVSNYRLGST